MDIHQQYQYKDLSEFLAKHNANSGKKEGLTFTHTRIGDKNMSIYGGSYIIPEDAETIFWDLYYDAVFVNKKLEYLTEKQLKDDCPILIDFDFRYNYDVDKRIHTKEHIIDIILLYLEIIKEFFIFTENKPFPIYVFEKPNVNRLADKTLTKDGIHIIIGIKMNHEMQLLLREKVLKKIEDIWDLPLINSWDTVLDKVISAGTTNWQIFGSRKPGNMAYTLTQYHEITFDETDKEFMMAEKSCTADINLKTDLHKLSARYSEHPSFETNPEIIKELSTTKIRVKKSTNTRVRLLIKDDEDDGGETDSQIILSDITNFEQLERAMDSILKGLKLSEYHIREIHEYTQILPSKYWEPGSHILNRSVAFALKHTDERLFLSWIQLRSKASDFDYGSITDLYDKWKKHFKIKENGITKKSILYWAKSDANEEYNRVKKRTVDYFLEETLKDPTDYDFAMVLCQLFKDKYLCSSLTNKTWYVFKNHHWEKDMGQSLRLAISREMYNEYQEKSSILTKEMLQYDPTDERYPKIAKRIKTIHDISTKLKKTGDKNNIFREAAEIFYDDEFVKKMDENRYLMCFTNGIVDLKNKTFRDGYPQDYITKTTGIPYYDISTYTNDNSKTIDQIKIFMRQLFPVEQLNKYMWEHLSSVLIGENKNQTFNIYRGNGSNGKSLLTDLMTLTLGEYAGMVPITLITEKRVGVGSTSSEIMQLKGVRYAVMQEPSKDAKINEGMMKQLTGDSSMTARALYCESEKFSIQFHLVVCTNTLFEIVSNDDGTWRRIRLVEFMSKFTNAEDPVDKEIKYQYLKEPDLKEKLPQWAPIFASMLVNIAFENQGKVENCDMVMAASNKYRQKQDHIAAFVSEMVIKNEGKDFEGKPFTIKKRELSLQFKDWFTESQGNKKPPKGDELYEYMDKKCGTIGKNGWTGYQILYSQKDEIEEMDD
jgi:P4 family phage/plasmid primase-like protien